MRTQWILIQREQTNQLRKAGTMGFNNPHGSSQWFDKPLRKQHNKSGTIVPHNKTIIEQGLSLCLQALHCPLRLARDWQSITVGTGVSNAWPLRRPRDHFHSRRESEGTKHHWRRGLQTLLPENCPILLGQFVEMRFSAFFLSKVSYMR